MTNSEFRWVIKPSVQIGARVAELAKAEPTVEELAQYHASKGETLAKATDAYTDRTGNLRQSTYGVADGTTIEIGATMDYAPDVELGTSKMAARPFLKPAADQTATEYFEDAVKVVDGILGGRG